MNKITLAALLLASAVAAPAHAAPTLFDISGGLFSDGTSFVGTFSYDTTSQIFSDFNVSTSTGTIPGFTYTTANAGAYRGGGAGPNNFILLTSNGGRYFNFSFASPLNSGSTPQNILTSQSYECLNCSPFRRVTAGSVIANVAAVPEPATWAMMFVGFGMMGASMRYRRKSTAVSFA